MVSLLQRDTTGDNNRLKVFEKGERRAELCFKLNRAVKCSATSSIDDHTHGLLEIQGSGRDYRQSPAIENKTHYAIGGIKYYCKDEMC
jgi:hypothetical protein